MIADTDRTKILTAATATLRQLADTIGAMSDADYAAPGALGASIGQHVRHTLDHFRTLADATPGVDTLDYDRRERGVPVETSREIALSEIDRICDTLADTAETLDRPCTVRATICGQGTEADLLSTRARELWFVTHHAIHHNALIKSLAHEKGIDLPGAFGRAPSTLEHDAATSRGGPACAPSPSS
jgi:uncharacterized damage-inducible protein DinB